MTDIVLEARQWFAAMEAARLDGFVVSWGDDSAFVIACGQRRRAVCYGEGVLQRAVDAVLDIIAEETAG